MHSVGRELLDRAGSMRWLRPLAAAMYRRRFLRPTSSRRFYGIFPDFAAAAAAAPQQSLLGHDHPAYAGGVCHSPGRPLPSDYPILFWLSKILRPGARVFDWGGNIGVSYYAYGRYLQAFDTVEWIVNDVPSVVALGRRTSLDRGAPNLQFTTSLAPMATCDVLLAAGSLQVIRDPFAELRRLPHLPTHILVNKIPIYRRPTAVTLLNNGVSFCPYTLFCRDDLVGFFLEIGYSLYDEWEITELSCDIPMFTEFSVPRYSGFYFVRGAS
jgi:putative methyltransferase (TIGR04325 family)